MYRDVLKTFGERYGIEAITIESPGRINLLGEHVDYNDGFVMPASINFATVFSIGEATDGISEIYALLYQETFRVDLNAVSKVESPQWANYLLGVIDQLLAKGHKLKPFKCVFGGDIPMGAGLSSSASVECGFAFALNTFNNLGLSRREMITMAQWSEHHYVGVMCGIMDQFASMMGAHDKIILLDCRSLEYRYVPFKLSRHAIVLCDTRVKHSLVDSEYNTRRQECEQGLQILKQQYHNVTSFRDVTEEMIEDVRSSFPGKVYDRCKYVVQEIRRVTEASADLDAGHLENFGKKMFETHEGLSKLYEVSCPELDFLVEEARHFKGVIGARMMGGGFGGCTINIVEKNSIDEFIDQLTTRYKHMFGIDMATYVVGITEGTHLVQNTVDA